MGLESKQVHNKPTDDYFFLNKHITKIMKSERHIWLRTNFVKPDVNKKLFDK